jgi:hypothetical protein
MVTSSTLIPPTVELKSSSSTLLPRKDSNASSSGTFSEVSPSYGQEENPADSYYALSSLSLPSTHYIIKCNVNTSMASTSLSSVTSMPPTPLPPSTLVTPRVRVTVEQSTINTCSSRADDTSEPITSSSLLKTPNLPIHCASSIHTAAVASSAPEFSISGTSSIDDSDELAMYERYLSISHGRQSNPSPEIRKKLSDDYYQMQQRSIPRSKSEVHTIPIEQIQLQIAKLNEIKPVGRRTSIDSRENND